MQNLPSPLAAESFILESAKVMPGKKYLELHQKRFLDSVKYVSNELGLRFGSTEMQRLQDFWLTVPKQLRDFNKPAFPRIEFNLENQELKFELIYRPCPPITQSLSFVAAVDSKAIGAKNKLSGIKGPHIDVYKKLNETHSGEVLLLDSAGNVLEGTTTAIVWWHDGKLFSVPKSSSRVDSITERIVLENAQKFEFEIDTKCVTPNELGNKPVWALNALHGIRRVDRINDHELPRADEQVFKRFKDWYVEIKSL